MSLVSGSFSERLRSRRWVVPMTVTADADGGREAEIPELWPNHLVGQRAGLRTRADRSFAGDGGRGDADQRFVRGSGGKFGPMMRVLFPWSTLRPRVGRCPAPGIPLGDDHQKRDLSIDRLDDGVLGELRRDEHVDVGSVLIARPPT